MNVHMRTGSEPAPADRRRLPVIFLKPGQLFLNEGRPVRPVKVVTVLGSCISLILTNAKSGMSAMCHAFMPCCDAGCGCTGNCREPYKYVRCALTNMTALFHRQGIRSPEIGVRLFGGSDMFAQNRWEQDRDGLIQSVGRQNTETALAMIKSARLHLTETDTGGTCGRKIFFWPHTGEIRVNRLKKFVKLD
ncbi:MAG: chemotaxis protein CheD [Desulfococcaceae bacterium]